MVSEPDFGASLADETKLARTILKWSTEHLLTRQASYSSGYRDADETDVVSLTWDGHPPEWLEGSLFRNGPGRYDRGRVEVSHWFDGLAMLHGFHLSPEGVQYHSRFVRSHDFRVSEQEGTIASPGFACDPCRSIFRKVASAFLVDATDNPNVSLVKQGDRFLALTELPIPMMFDPETLRSKGPLVYNDSLPPGSTTAHPHQDGKALYNQVLHYSGLTSYRFYTQEDLKERQEFARIKVKEASYVHSFGLSEDYVILTCCPFQVAPLKLLVRNKPFIHNFEWKPRHGTRFHLAPRPGKKAKQLTLNTEPFFCFHHVNSFQQNGKLYVDLICYPDADIIHQLSLERLRNDRAIDFGKLRRYEIDPQEETIERLWESAHCIELTRFHYTRCNTRPYRFLYGVSADENESVFYDRIKKLDVSNDSALTWYQPGNFPGEPIFVARPGSTEEDDGVLLSVVLNGEKETSFLLVLNAHDLREIARVNLPVAVPHGFHGLFHREFKDTE